MFPSKRDVGDGSFKPFVDYAAAGGTSLVVADFNHDGHTDIAVGGNVSVFLGNGDGTVQAPIVYPTPGADIRTTMNIYGDIVTDEMSRGHKKVAGLALNGAQTERIPS